MADKLVDTFIFNFSKDTGEPLILETKIYNNGDGVNGLYLMQKLTLQATFNEACFNLVGTVITPNKLRELANQLEARMSLVSLKDKNKKVVNNENNI